MAYRLVLGYAFVRRESEQNSSLQLLHGAAVEVLRVSSLGCSLDQFLCTRPCHVIGGDSDTSASIKRCENSIGLGGMARRRRFNYESHHHHRSLQRSSRVRTNRQTCRLDPRQSAPLGIHQRYEVDDVFDATIDAGDVSPVREGGTVAHLTGGTL